MKVFASIIIGFTHNVVASRTPNHGEIKLMAMKRFTQDIGILHKIILQKKKRKKKSFF